MRTINFACIPCIIVRKVIYGSYIHCVGRVSGTLCNTMLHSSCTKGGPDFQRRGIHKTLEKHSVMHATPSDVRAAEPRHLSGGSFGSESENFSPPPPHPPQQPPASRSFVIIKLTVVHTAHYYIAHGEYTKRCYQVPGTLFDTTISFRIVSVNRFKYFLFSVISQIYLSNIVLIY